LRLTLRGSPSSREIAKIFPATLKTEVSGPNGNVSSEPAKRRQSRLSALPFTPGW
jgi:hypothetical protein